MNASLPITPPRPRATSAELLPRASAEVPAFTARAYADLLGLSQRAIRKRLGDTFHTKTVRGQQACCWPLDDLPEEWRKRLEAGAESSGFRTAADFLTSCETVKRWAPRKPWSDVAVRFRAEATLWRDVLADIMPRWLAGESRAVLLSLAADRHLKITGRTVKSARIDYVALRTEERAAGSNGFDGPALYLDESAFDVHAPQPASRNWFEHFQSLKEKLHPVNHGCPTPEDRAEIFHEAFVILEELENLHTAEATIREISRALTDFLLERFPALARTTESLRAKLRQDRPRWIAGGRTPNALADQRRIKSGNFRRPDFSKDEREIAKLAVQLDGNESGARRLLEDQGKLSPEFVAFYPLDQRVNKSALPHTVRRNITGLVEATVPLRSGPKTLRDQGPYITRDWGNVRPGDRFVFDDVKWNHPFRYQQPDGTWDVTCGECLIGVDALTDYPLPFLLLARTGYNGLHLRRLFSRVHDRVGLPHEDLQLEGGTWESRFVVGEDAGWDSVHWRDFERGLNDPRIGINVVHSRIHRAKTIEGYFHHVQDRMRCIPGFVGFNERDYKNEHMQKLIARARRQDAEALAQFPTQEQWRDWIVQILKEFAHTPRNGARIPGRTAAEAWNEALLARPLRKLGEDVRHILDTHAKIARLDPKRGIVIKVPGFKNPICYVNDQTSALVARGERHVRVRIDLEHPERLTVSNMKGTHRFAVQGQVADATRASDEELAVLAKMRRAHQAPARALFGEIQHEVRSNIVRDDQHDAATKEDGRFHRETMTAFKADQSSEDQEIADLKRRATKLGLNLKGDLSDSRRRSAIAMELRGRELQTKTLPSPLE